MAFFTRRKTAAPRAAGFPATDEVKSKKLKSGDVFLKNGSNLFKLSLQGFSRLSVAAGAEGAFDLVGATSAAGTTTVIASFGSERAAHNALESVSSAFAGIASSGTFRWKRWVVCVGIAYVVLSMLSGLVKQTASAAVDSRVSAVQNQRLVAPTAEALAAAAAASTQTAQAAQPAAAPGGFNPHEQSLEELERLAKGGEYQFKPNVSMPDVQAPALNCDQSHAQK